MQHPQNKQFVSVEPSGRLSREEFEGEGVSNAEV